MLARFRIRGLGMSDSLHRNVKVAFAHMQVERWKKVCWYNKAFSKLNRRGLSVGMGLIF